MPRLLAAVLAAALVAAGHPGPSAASSITPASISGAAPNDADDTAPSLVARAEILLDRAHFSPGEIDGLDGDNFRNAIRAFQEATGLRSQESWTLPPGARSRPMIQRRP
jgi:peptidoglycan hydrolase-like protein with peptidoglycan-binding domain